MADLIVTAVITFQFADFKIKGQTFTMSTPLSGLTSAQNADTALTTEIATYITDVATRLQQAIATAGDSDAAVQAIANDLLSDAATLQNADPVTGTPTTPVTNVPIAGPNAPTS